MGHQVKYAIIGIALALNSGANAQVASPVTDDAGGVAASAQTNDPVDAGTAVARAQANGSAADNAGTPVTGAQANSSTAGDTGTSVAGAQSNSPVPGDAGTIVTGARATSPTAGDASKSSGEARVPSPIAIELHAGTSGGGAQVEYIFLHGYLVARASGDWFRISHSFSTIDAAYSGQANWATAGLFADLHPFKNGWFLSGGAFQGARTATVHGVPTQNIVIDGYTFTPEMIGTAMGEAKLDNTSPFVGMGWDQAQHDRSGVTFRILGGAAFGGAKLSLWDVGPYSDTPPVQQWIAQEQAYAQGKADEWKVYPVVQIGIGYRF
jgi:hypothetical protein